MRTLINPKSIFFINTIPSSILFYLMYNNFTLIQSLLDDSAKNIWYNFGIGLGTLILISILFTIFYVWKKLVTNLYYALLFLISNTIILYFYLYELSTLLPNSIPTWMVSDEVVFYAGTFLMPTLIHSLFILVASLTDENKKHNPIINFIYIIIIPSIWYLFFRIVLPLWKTENYTRRDHVITILFVLATILFLFFVIRWVYILSLKKNQFFRKYELLWKIPFAILFPLIGLAINNGFNPKSLSFEAHNEGVFGDFNGFWFYFLAVLNGLFICAPAIENKFYRYFLLILRSITFPYTFYFFLVFMPFLPFSILTIIFFGAGFLLLTPLLLFIIHLKDISSDFEFLKLFFSKRMLSISIAIGISILPAFIQMQFYFDKLNLNQATSYLYSPDYTKDYNLNINSIKTTLEKIKSYKQRNRNFFSFANSQTPFISSYFRWYVLENLTLSETKIHQMEKIFFGIYESLESDPILSEGSSANINISKIDTTSNYDTNSQTWKSTINLEITSNSNFITGEYATVFSLPNGAWISDYYLYVNEKKEKGLLSEKKAATWVYSQIREVRRDPGILFYIKMNQIQFRVFPFSPHEIRKTGFEIIHKTPIEFKLDGKLISLGEKNKVTLNTNEKVIFIPSEMKQKLPIISRKPYYHFLIDTSIGNEIAIEEMIKKVDSFLIKKPLLTTPRFSSVNLYIKSLNSQKWKEEIKKIKLEGGFFVDRAIRKYLVESYLEGKNEFPIFILVKSNPSHKIQENDFSNLSFTFPENIYFYDLNVEGKTDSYSLLANSIFLIKEDTKIQTEFSVYEFNIDGTNRYLPLSDKSEIVLRSPNFKLEDSEIKEKNWTTALLMQGKWMSYQLFPNLEEREWVSLVRSSFIAKIMNPYTSYIVLENEAQKEALKRKQENILSSNKSLDAGEDVIRMSEPNFIILFILLFITSIMKNKLTRKKNFESK